MKKAIRRVLTVHMFREHVGGESMDPLAASGSHSLNIDAEYVSVSQILSLSFNIT